MAFYIQRSSNKYGAKKTIFNGLKYDSKGEAGHALELNLRLKAGQISKVERQRTFPLYGKNGGRITTHRVDFLVTYPDGHQEVEEYKGFVTQIWKIKRDLFVDNYPEILYNVITSRGNYYAKNSRKYRKN
jgi:hypothetical protein